jgi:putative flavoprotein involved in K+ transport
VAPEEPPAIEYPISASERTPIERVDLRGKRISAILWAIGFATDFNWIHAPVFAADGRPMHYRGVTTLAGLYFLRIAPFYKRKATLIDGVEEDAVYLAEQITTAVAVAATAG